MLRNYLAAALRNLVRNRLYTAINIAGLAVAFAAALSIGVFIRSETTFDTWILDHDQVYRVSFVLKIPGQGPAPWDYVPGHIGPWLKLDFPQIAAVARLTRVHNDAQISVRHGAVEGTEYVHWADSALAEVLPLPVIAGDFAAALKDPAAVAITRAMARKYFGRDVPLGDTLEIGRDHLLTIGAVLEDLPSNTHLAVDIIGSGLAAFSDLARVDSSPGPQIGEAYTYLRFKPGTDVAAFAAALPEFLDRRMPPPAAMGGVHATELSDLELLPLTELHLHPSGVGAMKPAGNLDLLYALGVVAALIVLVAAINFINLMTARAARRSLEVGVRKVMGAARRDLVMQFLGEALLYALTSIVLAAALAAALISELNSLIGRSIPVAALFAPMVVAATVGTATTVGLSAGAYPALLLSRFPPGQVLRIALVRGGTGGFLRQAFVAAQFAVLVLLILSTATISRQVSFAIEQSLRFGQEPILLVETACDPTLRDEARKIPGVHAAACAGGVLAGFDVGGLMLAENGHQWAVLTNYVDFDFFPLYGFTPLAGRLFDSSRGIDQAGRCTSDHEGGIVLNESAVRHLGYASPEAAIGGRLPGGMKCEVIGVVPDLQLGSVAQKVQPTAYFMGDPQRYKFLSLRLDAANIPATLDAVDKLWARLGEKPRPIARRFFDQYVNTLYTELDRQQRLFSILGGLCVFIACLGLFGLSSFTAERRIKEIGIRKAMGAGPANIAVLLAWEFAKPVLWANVIAWPVGYVAMRRWLEGFAYHVDMEPWIFLASSVTALAIALLTVAGHALAVSRAQPVSALRYE